MVLLKTNAANLAGVKKFAKHASEGVLRQLAPGGTLLIQVTANSSSTAVPIVKYAMTFVRCYPDTMGETIAIWHRRWRYVIEGRDIFQLRRPFDIRRVQVTTRNYGRGAIRFVYLADADANAIRIGGHLEPLD